MSAGQVSDGGCESFTITLKPQLAVPHTFDAVQLTAFVPTGNALPEVGVQVTVGAGVPVLPTVKSTLLEHWPGAAGTVMSLGQVIVGAESTVTVFMQEPLQPPSAVTVRFKVYDPTPVASTSTFWLLFGPTMVPLPVTTHR